MRDRPRRIPLAFLFGYLPDTRFYPVIHAPNSIWPSGDSFTGPTPAYFRREFAINGIPTNAALSYLIVDDDVRVFVNGALVLNDGNTLASEFSGGINILPFLHQGNNLLAIKAHDHQGTEGIFARFTVTFTPAPPVTVPEPQSAVLAVLSLAAILGIAYRRHTAAIVGG